MKILINSYPKSGSQSFAHVIKRAVRETRIPNETELPENGGWIVLIYDPVVNLAKFDNDVTQISIIRNPSDAITINTERHFRGFMGNRAFSDDIVAINQANTLDTKESLTPGDMRFIDHQIERYNSYINCLEMNFDKILCFTHEQTRTQTEQCVKNALSYSGVDYSEFPPHAWQNNIVDTIGYHPFAVKIREYVESHPDFAKNYNSVLNQIMEKQQSYPVPLNS